MNETSDGKIKKKHEISCVFPAYNEVGNIKKTVINSINVLKELSKDFEIIVVNDGSKDGTGEVIKNLASKNGRIIAVQHEKNLGYGAALLSGFGQAKKELIFFSDSDLQFDLSEISLLLSWVDRYDLVLGYRKKRRDNFIRRVNAWGWTTLIRLIFGTKFRDINCAFKIIKSEVIENILKSMGSRGAMINSELLIKATKLGYSFKEIPITHYPRLEGKQTGANPKVVLRAFKELFVLYKELSNYHKKDQALEQ